MKIFDEIAKHGHEQVALCHDQATGLRAVIAIHNTILGPALGGVRMWPFASEEEAIADVIRLAKLDERPVTVLVCLVSLGRLAKSVLIEFSAQVGVEIGLLVGLEELHRQNDGAFLLGEQPQQLELIATADRVAMKLTEGDDVWVSQVLVLRK